MNLKSQHLPRIQMRHAFAYLLLRLVWKRFGSRRQSRHTQSQTVNPLQVGETKSERLHLIPDRIFLVNPCVFFKRFEQRPAKFQGDGPHGERQAVKGRQIRLDDLEVRIELAQRKK